MAEHHDHATPSHDAPHRAQPQPATGAEAVDAFAVPTPLPGPAPNLLAAPRLAGRGTAGLRAAAVQSLQRTHGNRATARLLRHSAAPDASDRPRPDGVPSANDADRRPPTAPASGLPLQRAVGFEIEITSWLVQHGDGSRLAKRTEPIIEAEGFELTADDAQGASDIEFVTEPPLESEEVSNPVVEAMAELGQALEAYNTNPEDPARKRIAAYMFGAHGTPHKDAFLVPGSTMKADFQATLGVPLEMLPKLYEAMEAGEATGLSILPANVALTRWRSALEGEPGPTPIPTGEMSAALKGFLLLVIDYIVQGFVDQLGENYAHAEFPKGLFNLLAKTRFDEMLRLIPDKANILDRFGEMKDEWIEWIITAALSNKKDFGELGVPGLAERPMLGQHFQEQGTDEKPYIVNVPRGQWLEQMPKQDLLSEAKSPKLQGMGAFGRATDELISPNERADLAEKMTEQVVKAEGSQKGEEKEKEKEKEYEQPARAVEASRPGTAPGSPPQAAPIFELRNIDLSGPPSTWTAYAKQVWKLYRDVIGDLIYRKRPKKASEGEEKGEPAPKEASSDEGTIAEWKPARASAKAQGGPAPVGKEKQVPQKPWWQFW